MQSFSSIHPQVFQLPSQKKSSARPGNERGAGGGGPYGSHSSRALRVRSRALSGRPGCSIANCHRATGSTATRAAPTAHEEPHTRDSSQITPVLADKGRTRGTCHSGLALRAALAARLPIRRAVPRAPIAAGRSSEARAARETGPDPAGRSRGGHGEAGPPGPRPAARPPCPARITRGHRRGAGLPGDGLQGKRRGTAAEAGDECRCLTRGRPRCSEERGREGARGHARDSLTRPPRRAGVLPAAAFCRSPLRDQSRLSAEAAAAANGTAGRGETRCYWSAAGEARPERRPAAGMAGRALAGPVRSVPSCGRGAALGSAGAGKELCGGGRRRAARVGRSVCAVTACVNLVLCVWGYCEIIASPG